MPTDVLEPPAASTPVNGVAVPPAVWDAGTRLFSSGAAFERWLKRPRPHFGGRTPLSLIDGGEAEAVRTLIVQLTHGVFP